MVKQLKWNPWDPLDGKLYYLDMIDCVIATKQSVQCIVAICYSNIIVLC